MKILSWNVNGIRAAQRKGFLEWLSQEDPAVLCIQETKASPEQLAPELTSPDCCRAYFSSADRKGYSGVATYTRPEPERMARGFGIEKFDREGRVLQMDYGDFLLFNIYFPNGKSFEERLEYKMEFYDAFLRPRCATPFRWLAPMMHTGRRQPFKTVCRLNPCIGTTSSLTPAMV